MKELNIKIENLTEAQAITIEEMFAIWLSLSNIGSSRMVGFFADGDGNFHPKIIINGEKPEYKAKKLGVEFRENNSEYRLDFDEVAWKLRELNNQQ